MASLNQPEEQESPTQPAAPAETPPMRWWPAVAMVALMWLIRVAAGLPEQSSFQLVLVWVIASISGGAAVMLWLALASRLTWPEKLVSLVGIVAVLAVSVALADPTVRGFFNMVHGFPWGVTAFVVVIALLSWSPPVLRTGAALVAATLAMGYMDLVRVDAIDGDFKIRTTWRWTPTHEDQLANV